MSASDDPAALVGLDIADEVESNSLNELLTVTNNFNNTFDFTIELTGDASKEDFNLVINGEEEGNFATVAVDPGSEESQQINIDIDGGGHNEADEISFDVDVSGQNGESVSLSRDGIGVTNPGPGGGNDDDEDPPEEGDEEDAEITLSFDNRSGNSDNRDYSWTTDPIIEGGSVEFRVNDDLIEDGLPQNEDDYRDSNGRSGDTVTVVLVNDDGDEVTSDSVTLP
ncbi:hypothetical protein [Natranaeroarchaeum sulfidigenes]|nr:hypothetical protein [Natranaeroarchaeum sulfidigenes]